jgi:hypothetical protein
MEIVYVNLDKEIETLNQAQVLKVMKFYRTWILNKTYDFAVRFKG